MLNPKTLSATVALVLASASVSVPAAGSVSGTLPAHARASVHGGVDRVVRDAQGRVLYMVMLADPPAAMYHGSGIRAVAGLAKIPSVSSKGGKVDLRSAQAAAYVAHLAGTQGSMVAQLQSQGIPLQPVQNYRYALNGFTAWLSDADARRVAATPGVRAVTRMRENPLLTDRGPGIIGAPQLWFGNSAATGDTLFLDGFEEPAPGNRGEGVTVGMLDTGINFDSPSFADPDASGYHYVNPLGDGNYLGWCNSGYAVQDPCNNKVIGSWDFVTQLAGGVNYDPPGTEDENGHGSHTASTAAGNTRQVDFMGHNLTISGVAPHANLVAFDVCYTNTTTGQGSCPYDASTDAIEQALEDGVVDVMNFSIGGGGDPWNDPVELAFLSAVDSGIFVAAAAGNSGPDAGTVEHLGPWVTTVAASTHDRSDFYWTLQPAGGALVQMFLGSAGAQPGAPLPAGTQLILSPQFDIVDTAGSDGCSAYPAGTFQGGIALISRGTCAFSVKAANAVAAGAVMVVIANNQGGNAGLAPSGTPQVAVPVFGTTQSGGDYLAGTMTDGKVIAEYSYPATTFPQTPDVMADFSSRGPASVNLLKPDVSAPGVAILAAMNGDADALGIEYGTSMATPHVAGSAALLRKAHPEWTPMEIKSALMLTAKSASAMLEEDESTPATPFDAGGGRVQVDQAAKAGLVMDEDALNMYLAAPALGGDLTQINLASLYDDHCAGACDFSRSMTGVLPGSQQWTVSTSIAAPLVVSAPASITATNGVGVPLDIQVDASAATTVGYYFGEVSLSADGNADTPVLHMPIVVQVPPPTIDVSPASASTTAAAGSSASIPIDLVISNTGGVPLAWSWAQGSNMAYVAMNQPSTNNSGYPSSTYGGEPNNDIWLADDFDVGAATTLTFLRADGFQLPDIQALSGMAATVTFQVYADASGVPDGAPDGSGNAPVFACSLPVNSSALSYSGYDSVTLDIAGSGCATAPLAAGKYWLSVSGDYAGTGEEDDAETWYWFESTTGSGDPVQVTYPGAGGWGGIDDVFGDPPISGNAMRVSAVTDCDGAAWLIPATTAGSVGPQGQQTLTVTIAPTGLAAGDYSANACLSSNDPARSMVVVPVTLHVE